MASYFISNKNTKGEFLRNTLQPDESGDVNFDIQCHRWQTYSKRIADRKAEQGFVVREFATHADFQAAAARGELED